MRALLCILFLIQIAGCSSGGSADASAPRPPGEPYESVVHIPQQFLASANTDGTVLLQWRAERGLTYEVYSSSDPALEPENYSVYDNAGFEQNVLPPFVFNPPEKALSYTFKIIARRGASQSLPATDSAYTRFIVSHDDPSIYFDPVLNLQIKRCAQGQQYDHLTDECRSDATQFTAAQITAHMDLVGDGWRLPTTKELDGLGPCDFLATRPACVPAEMAPVIADFFIGSNLAPYFDSTVLEPLYLQIESTNALYYHVHNFPDHARAGSARYDSEAIKLHALLVRSAGD